jgi:hypothetical protein
MLKNIFCDRFKLGSDLIRASLSPTSREKIIKTGPKNIRKHMFFLGDKDLSRVLFNNCETVSGGDYYQREEARLDQMQPGIYARVRLFDPKKGYSQQSVDHLDKWLSG